MKSFVTTLIAALVLLMPSSAMASDWHLAETANFRLYSRDDAESTRAFAEDLERLDQAMRIISGIGPAQEPIPDYSKVTVFRFGDTRDMGNLIGRRGVGGFFIPRAGQPVAFVPQRTEKVRGLGQRASGLELDPKGVLYHEYAHYFMYYHAPAAYPSWYTEGFAEIFYTVELDKDRFTIGAPPDSRALSIGAMRPDTVKMFDPDPDGERGGRDIARIYGHGWLLSSYLLLDPTRQGQLNQYVLLLNQGRNSLEAAEEVFGDLKKLDSELNDYRQSKARLLRVPYYDDSTPEVSIRPLTDAEEAVISLVVDSKSGVTESDAKRQIDPARKAVERFPQSIPVLLAAMEVEFDNKNYDEAEALADRILALDADNLEAAIYRAEVSMARGADDAEHYQEARQRFLAANKIQSSNPRVLGGYYRTYALTDDVLTENAALAIEAAYAEATYDATLRSILAHRLLTEGRDDEAFVVMTPTINNPHNPGGRRILALFESDDPADREKLVERLTPRPYGYEPPEDEDDAS